MRRAPLLRAAAVTDAAILGCTNSGENRITVISSTGTVTGVVYLDSNGSRVVDAGDDSLANAGVRLVHKGGQGAGLEQNSAANGSFTFSAVPVGDYSLQLDTAGFADTLQLVRVDSLTFTVQPGATSRINILAGRPLVTVAQARALPVGRKVFVVGVALASTTTFADTTTDIADVSGGLRVARARTAFAAGDSLRLLGTVARRDSQPVLNDPTVFALGKGFFPAAATLTTAAAATASGGTRDAQMVIVHGALISDTLRTATSFVLTVSDSSGQLQVQLDQTADVAFQTASLPGSYVPGNRFDLLGVLTPTGTGTWRLKPRSAADLNLIPPTPISIRAARALGPGQTVTVIGTALNSSTTFSDTTVSLVDTSGAIRLTRLRTAVSAGDSVRVRAVTASRSGQPTLDGGTTTALGRGLFPPAAILTSAAAATAAGGTRDAQLVQVLNATVNATATVLGNYQMTVSDGSGNLTVVLDQVAGFTVPGIYVVSNVFDVVGLLVPTGTGSWTLKPRSPADLVKH